MEKNIILFALQLVLSFNLLNGQVIAAFPNGLAYNDTAWSSTEALTHHNELDTFRGRPITQTVNTLSCVITQGQKWEAGTWYRGYQDYYATKNKWCSIQDGGKYLSNHPLIRQTSEIGRAYMHLSRQFNDTIYFNRMKWATQYLTNAQNPDGGFIWWYHRPTQSTTNTNSNGNSINNPSNAYEAAHGLITLANNYWYLRSIGDSLANSVYDDIEHGATKYLTEMYSNVTMEAGFDGGGAINYKGFAIWALAEAYKVTANKKYLLRAIELFNTELVPHQNKTSGSIHFGTWTGVSDYVKYTNGSSTTISVQREALIWYHFIILRGLVETLTAMHELSSSSLATTNISAVKDSLYLAIERGVNHVINHRFAANNQMTIYPSRLISGNLQYYDFGGSIYTMPSGVTEYVVPDAGITTIGMLTYHALYDSHYSSTDVNRLINLLNRAIRGEYPGTGNAAWYLTNRPSWYFTNYATYTDYIKTIRNKLQTGSVPGLANQLKRVVKVDDDLLYTSSGSNYYYDNPCPPNPSINQTIPISSTLGAVENWIKGDFNGDGNDEIYFKKQGSNNIFFSTDINFSISKTTTVYSPNSGNPTLKDWIKGDFNGDGRDELLYQLSDGNIYRLFSTDQNPTNHLSFTNATLVPKTTLSTAQIEKWIIGDFNGDGRDELLYKFVGSPIIYKNSSGINSLKTSNNPLTAEVVYNGALVLDKWIVGDFESGTNRADGKDDLIYKFSAHYIYKCSNIANITGTTNDLAVINSTTNVSVYTGTIQIDKWIVGDFDGDLDQELLQTFVGINKIYYSEYGTVLGNGLAPNQVNPSSGFYTNPLKNWIVGDFDGDKDDDLIYWFELPVGPPPPPDTKVMSGNPIYILDNVKDFPSAAQYSTIEPNNWLVGNFNAAPTIVFRSNNNTTLSPSKNEIASKDANFNIFPNPFKNELNILINLEEADNVSISIYDIYGKLVKTIVNERLEKDDYTFKYKPSPDLKSKMLVVIIQSNQINTAQKVIVME
jgi:Secretion system C-terminal sorting domain